MVAFAVPPTAKAVLELLCQLRDGPRDDAWQVFVNVIASGRYDLLPDLWELLTGRLGLTVTGTSIPPTPHAVRESACIITSKVAWRV